VRVILVCVIAITGFLVSFQTKAADVVRDISYKFCLSEFKDYERAALGDPQGVRNLSYITGGEPEILVTDITKDKEGNLSVDAIYAFSEGKPEKVALRCSINKSTLKFSKDFLRRAELNIARIQRENDPEYQRQQREHKRALAQKQRAEKAKTDAKKEKENKAHAPKIKAIIEECWNFGISGTWPTRIYVREGRIGKVKVLSKAKTEDRVENRNNVINRARLAGALDKIRYSCPALPIEGPVLVNLGPTKAKR
jgi:hypothetical protein